MAVCFIGPELLPLEVLHSEIYYFFAPVTLTLTQWPSYMKMTCIPTRYNGYAKMNFVCQDFRKLSYYTACIQLRVVTSGHVTKIWRSYHSIRHIQNPLIHVNVVAVCFIELELLPMKILHCRNRDFRPFCMLPWRHPMTIIYELDPYSLEIYRGSQCSTLVRHCCKGDTSSQWEIAIFGHLELRNPWTDRVKIWHVWSCPAHDPTYQNWDTPP